MAMLLQTVQTKYHHQVLLHDAEIIILAQDIVLDHTSHHNHRDVRHRYRSHSWSNSQRSHSRSYHRHPHTSTSHHRHSNTYHHPWDTPHRRSSLHKEALPPILEIAVGQNHIPCTELPIWHPPNPPTALTGQPGKTRIRNINKSPLMTLPSNYYSSDEPSSESDEDLN